MVIKLTVFISLFFSVNLLALENSLKTRFTYDFTGMTVREVFQVLEQQSKFRFFYNEDFKTIDKIVDLNVKDENVEGILDKIFSGSDISIGKQSYCTDC